MKMDRRKVSLVISIIVFLILFVMNNDGRDKKEGLNYWDTYLEDNIYFILSLEFTARVIVPLNGEKEYRYVWLTTKNTDKEIEIWNEKIELLKEKIENGIPIYTREMEEKYLLKLIELDETCSFYMLGDRKDNQIQIMDLKYVSVEDIYERIEEVIIYRYFLEINYFNQ